MENNNREQLSAIKNIRLELHAKCQFQFQRHLILFVV